jgi:predicted CXXCH cytochrome family protein
MKSEGDSNSVQAGSALPRRAWKSIVLAAGCVALGVLGWRLLGNRSHSLDGAASGLANPAAQRVNDPRLTYPSPYLNVRPEVKYVGDAACAGCHAAHAESYHKHPMGRSFVAAGQASPLERYDSAAHNPFTHGLFTYRVEKDADQVRHSETVLDSDGKTVVRAVANIQYAVGSGRNGRAYLIDHEGYLFASPITWYPLEATWDLSPGYQKNNPHFGRTIAPSCLFCHANSADHVSGTANRYRSFTGEAIGCERCHGPGELHVERRTGGSMQAGFDETIVNPARLDHALREAVCQQCHLQGHQRVLRRNLETFDYRPGLPIQLFMSDFVDSQHEPDEAKFVGTVEQMYTSVCFQKSQGPAKLGCISCHDPHTTPAAQQKAAYFRDRCQKCHNDRGCSLPQPERGENNCVACHMPPTGSNLQHTSISDHRILRRPLLKKTSLPAANATAERRPASKEWTLVNFHGTRNSTLDPEDERDLAIALMREGDRRKDAGGNRVVVERALALLESALQRDDRDEAAWEARGNALWDLGRRDEAATAYERVLQIAPHREGTLFKLADLVQRRGEGETARSLLEQAIQANPWKWEYHLALARVHAQNNNWQGALRSAQEVVKLNPFEPNAHRFLVVCRLRLGDRAESQKAFETLIKLNPAQADELRRWYTQQLR